MKKSVLFLLMLMAGTFSFAQSKRELVTMRKVISIHST